MSPIEIEVLDRLEKGLIRLTPENEVEIIRYNRWYKLKKHIHYSGRARYKLRNTYVYANRLIFILKTKCAIPEGFLLTIKMGIKLMIVLKTYNYILVIRAMHKEIIKQ